MIRDAESVRQRRGPEISFYQADGARMVGCQSARGINTDTGAASARIDSSKDDDTSAIRGMSQKNALHEPEALLRSSWVEVQGVSLQIPFHLQRWKQSIIGLFGGRGIPLHFPERLLHTLEILAHTFSSLATA